MYDPKTIESRWQAYWEEHGVYAVSDTSDKPKSYVLDMFPYPSGAGLHVGHPKGYIATDIYSRFKRMKGFNVLHPMGWDAFGLPAENYAIKHKVHPRVAVEKNVEVFKTQLQHIGLNFDWSREINTTDPEYYKWTQWCVSKMFEAGLMEEVHEPIIWCPTCKTGLALEDLDDGVCERCGSTVEKKPLRQWVIKITKYADRLLEGLEELDWEDSIKDMQRHWIGRSEGAEVQFGIIDVPEPLTVFTTRPDTLFGATYMVVAPEHPMIHALEERIENIDDVKAYVQASSSKTDLDRQVGKEKTGVPLQGIIAINPINGEEIPVWVADYVMMGYGTGAIMAVPAHDERDFVFAKKFNLPIKEVVSGGNIDEGPFVGSGIVVHSDFLDGLTKEDAISKAIEWLETNDKGVRKVQYKLRDWVFARQRYWGEPFPFVHTDDGNVKVVDIDQLPVMLPDVEQYEPTGTGESPLAGITDWVTVPGGKRETNTMPQWAGSSWYYLRYIDPKNKEALVDKKKEQYWMGDKGVDLYVGGTEHATRHLIYARFWHKFLFDQGVVSTKEPFHKLINVGLIMAEDGRKMSKRWNNVVNPDDVIVKYGADSFRMYEMFIGPFTQSAAWNTQGVEGVYKFLQRYTRLYKKELVNDVIEEQEVLIHKAIKKVGEDIDAFRFNTAVSEMMIVVNTLTKAPKIQHSVLERLNRILAPFAVYLSEELYHTVFNGEGSIHHADWPVYDEAKLVTDTMTIVVQVNGKVRDTIDLSSSLSEEEVKVQALGSQKIIEWLDGNEPKKVIYITGKLVSIVV
ncbi:MAG: leucine--tRNA ligase [Candidatus Magasanikbacteria bacterium]|nr:leucine--tRNA ligase [Candidatus Magasanikbacteria bacterium]MBT4221458.1 leucine--tRNA ligase [Candidatus Magasanikbacteria bacterium]MBT4350694.1 leucine--tRNA ligase [Candidatus Magasanikbacteria bacterium]MBT4541630.1 leucine--tRNA ligase [Candidatus Magasanikbacteria bacterium]MBT6252927.1 leucine--tRNA ligase [Candidatus Magasanikbacteria bacterium]